MAQGVRTQDQLEEVVSAYKEFDEFVIDVETKGEHRLSPLRNDVFWLSLAGPGRCDVIPFGHPLGERVLYDEDDEMHRIQYSKAGTPTYQERRINETSGRLKWFKVDPQFTEAPSQLWRSDVMEALRPLIYSERRKVGHVVKFDLQSIAKYYNGEMPPPPYGDTMVAARLVDENQLGYSLADCVRRQFHFRYTKIGKAVETYPYSEAYYYSYCDGKFDWLLWRVLEPLLKKHKVEHIFEVIEMPLVPLIMEMETQGMAIDEDVLNALGEEIAREMAQIQLAVNERAGKPINLNSNRQKAELVYDIIGKTCREYTKTGERKVDKETLETFRKNKTVGQILEHSSLSKLQSSFIVSLQTKAFDGKVHPSFNQVGARSGRTSCSEPNIQQMPQRSERGRKVRQIFVASPKHLLIVADLSQIELRVLAHFTQDPRLLRAYRQNLDLHAMTAEAVWGEDFTKAHRDLAKNGNFSCVFGAGPSVLVRKYDYPNIMVAKRFLRTFYQTYRRVEPWKDEAWHEARRRHRKGKSSAYVETILGRRRRLPALMSADDRMRWGAERQAISTIIQGSAADLFKVIMLDTTRAMADAGVRGHILMTVHDEVIAEVPTKEAEVGLALVKDTMENVLNPFTKEPILSVPLVADAKIVERWSDAK